jgi:hypothetical protein
MTSYGEYGEFELDGVQYFVTASAGPHTVGVYESASTWMVCTVRDPLGEADAQWGRDWIARPPAWQSRLLEGVADVIRQFRSELDRGLETHHPPRPRGGRP